VFGRNLTFRAFELATGRPHAGRLASSAHTPAAQSKANVPGSGVNRLGGGSFIDRDPAAAVPRALFEVTQGDQFGERVLAQRWWLRAGGLGVMERRWLSRDASD
jgi:hypothetical protein